MVGGAVGLAMTWTVPTIASGYANDQPPPVPPGAAMKAVTMHQARTRLSRLVAEAGEEVIITRDFAPAVRLARPDWWTVPEAVRHSWGTIVLQLVDARLPDSGTLLAPAVWC